MKPIRNLLEKLNLTPNNLAYYETAVTHPSVHGDEVAPSKDYERLEFMGDAVISFVVAELAYLLRPDLNQGKMTKMRAHLVQSKALSAHALKLDLGSYIRVGASIRANQNQFSMRLYEDVFEAFVGAIFIDLGYDVVKQFLVEIFKDEVINFNIDMLADYKSELQEAIQAERRDSVSYVVVNESGPAHARIFSVECRYGNLVLGTGVGETKKEAEQMAAKEALAKKAV